MRKQGLKMKPDYASLFLKMLTLATWAQIYATLDITTRQHTLTPKGSLSLGTKQNNKCCSAKPFTNCSWHLSICAKGAP